MSIEALNATRRLLAAQFEELSDTWLPAAISLAVVEYGGTLIGPEDPGGPVEYQLEMLGVTGFGGSPEAAARQWTLNIARMCDPAEALEDAECD